MNPHIHSHIKITKCQESFRQLGFYKYLVICKISCNIYRKMMSKHKQLIFIYINSISSKVGTIFWQQCLLETSSSFFLEQLKLYINAHSLDSNLIKSDHWQKVSQK